MSILQAVLIGVGGGLVAALAAICVTHRSIWGHWRFWRHEFKHRGLR